MFMSFISGRKKNKTRIMSTLPCESEKPHIGKRDFSLSVNPPSEIVVYLGGGYTYFLFSPLPGEMIQFD